MNAHRQSIQCHDSWVTSDGSTSPSTDLVIRRATSGDAEGCAQAWLDAGRFYAQLDGSLKVPDEGGLIEFFESTTPSDDGPETTLVAERDGQVLGFVALELMEPDPFARFQLQPDLAHRRVAIHALAVAQDYRRSGVGTSLMTAAENWARDRGARSLVLDTNIRSPVSVPFYEDRMGYTRHGIIFRKEL